MEKRVLSGEKYYCSLRKMSHWIWNDTTSLLYVIGKRGLFDLKMAWTLNAIMTVFTQTSYLPTILLSSFALKKKLLFLQHADGENFSVKSKYDKNPILISCRRHTALRWGTGMVEKGDIQCEFFRSLWYEFEKLARYHTIWLNEF